MRPRAETWNNTTYHGHGIGHLGNDNLDGLNALSISEVIGPKLLEATLGLGWRQSRKSVGAELLGHFLKGQGMGRTSQRLVGLP